MTTTPTNGRDWYERRDITALRLIHPKLQLGISEHYPNLINRFNGFRNCSNNLGSSPSKPLKQFTAFGRHG